MATALLHHRRPYCLRGRAILILPGLDSAETQNTLGMIRNAARFWGTFWP
jgi:hypothetical protein